MFIVDEIKKEALNVINQSKDLLSELDQVEEWNSFTEVMDNMGEIVGFFTKVVVIVENIVRNFQEDFTSGEDKLEAASQILDELIVGNIWLEIIDKFIFKIIISIIVHYINQKYGHIWPEDAK